MVHSTRTEDWHKAPSLAWTIQDVQLLRQLLPDLQTIAELGDVDDFKSHVRREVPMTYLDQRNVPYELNYGLQYDPVESLAGVLGIEHRTLHGFFVWVRNRERTLAVARLIRDEAERLRKGAR